MPEANTLYLRLAGTDTDAARCPCVLNYPNVLISLYENTIAMLVIPVNTTRPDSDIPRQSHSNVPWPNVLLFAIYYVELHADLTCI